MNALSAGWALQPSGTRPSLRPYLQLVRGRRSQAARAPFVVVVVALLLSGLLSLLLLNTVLAQDAFRLHILQVKGHTLADHEQALAREVSDLQSPRELAARATALGMVPGGSPAFLRLADGKVLGHPEAGASGPAANAANIGTAAALSQAVPAAPNRMPGQQRPAAKARPRQPAPAEGGWTVVTAGARR